MSLIDQALKKTQSELFQKKTNSGAPHKPVLNDPLDEPIRPGVRNSHNTFVPSGNTMSRNISLDQTALLDFISNRWVIRIGSLILVSLFFLFIHQHISNVGARYENFYSHLYESFLPQKVSVKTPVLPAPAATPKPFIPSLELEGTLQVGNDHVAMINQQLIHPGDSIDGYQVEKVNDNAVVLENTITHQERELTQSLSK